MPQQTPNLYLDNDGSEGSDLLSMVDDPLGQCWADPREALQGAGIRAIHVHRGRAGPACSRRELGPVIVLVGPLLCSYIATGSHLLYSH